MILTRLESWAMPGIPDLMICDGAGKFHMIELKVTQNHAVELRPHQVAFLSKHQHAPVWVLVYREGKGDEPSRVYLYPGADAVDLRMYGLDKVEPVALETAPVQWENIFRLIFGEHMGNVA